MKFVAIELYPGMLWLREDQLVRINADSLHDTTFRLETRTNVPGPWSFKANYGSLDAALSAGGAV